MFFRLVRAGFGRRRKTHALSADPDISKRAAVGAHADARAETNGDL